MDERRIVFMGYAITLGLVLIHVIAIICILNMITRKPEDDKGNNVQTTEETECVMIDGNCIPMVYGDDGSPYLKYVIHKSNVYIPVPTEPDTATDSLQFYYTKNQKNERRF